MPSLPQLIPSEDLLLQLQPEELGAQLLKAAATAIQNGLFNPSSVTGDQALFGPNNSGQHVYSQQRRDAIIEATDEAWLWLELNMLIMPAPGINGNNGFKVFTRRGRSMLQNPANFSKYTAATRFPKDLIHPSIREAVWLELARGDFDAAVFKSFRAVEIATREAAQFGDQQIGVDLMRNAFSPNKGPLAKNTDHKGEQAGLMELFTGAMGTFKNPQSHRTVGLDDPEAAQQMVAFASWLLSVVESRRKS